MPGGPGTGGGRGGEIDGGEKDGPEKDGPFTKGIPGGLHPAPRRITLPAKMK